MVDHPLVAQKLGLLRDRRTTTAQFRQLTREISLLLGYEATRFLALESATTDTPLEPAAISRSSGKKLCFVSILRAGDGMLAGMLDLVPSARVGQIGLARDHHTLRPVEYVRKLPADLARRTVIVLDPALATGHPRSPLSRRSARPALARCASSASSPHPRASPPMPHPIPEPPSSPPPSIAGSMLLATSAPASATPATACPAPADAGTGSVIVPFCALALEGATR